MSQKLKPGDLVELISGGPTMSVDMDWGDGTFRCTWFAGAKLNSGNFNTHTLRIAESDD